MYTYAHCTVQVQKDKRVAVLMFIVLLDQL